MPIQVLVRALSEAQIKEVVARHAGALMRDGAKITYSNGLLAVAGMPGQGAELVQEVADADADAQAKLRAGG